ncbi:MAG TPA: N,N-dimethylformamidase beta subunit family domain-containing protein [Rhizomicrobium sp.]
MLAFYTDKLSVRPGESFALYASGDGGPCTLEIARVGAGREVMLRQESVAVEAHATPANADRDGCGWPAALTVTAGEDWRSGYYDLVLTDAKGGEAHHFVCVRAGGRRNRMVLILATNTLHAYNYWGGASAYCHVESLMRREATLAGAMANAIGVLSTERPFPPLLLAPPPEMPRLVNLRPRGFEEKSWAGANPRWSRDHAQSPYDGSAGYLHNWEHAFVRWAEGEENLAFDYLTDFDLDRDSHALDGYHVVLLVGHSEYWSGRERDAIEAFVERGGRLAIFSGNTAFWKVRWENGGNTLICHKWKGESEAVADADKTHLWSHPLFGRGEAAITGLSFLYGGYHRLGLCAARGAGGYTIYRDKHWALEGTDLYYGDVIGGDIPLVGYENDGCPIRFDANGLPAPDGGVGVPDNLEIVAFVPAAFTEAPDNPYRPLIPPEQMDVVARVAYGDASLATQARVSRGHAVMASFTRGKGEVFNAGTTEWAYGLAANDPFVMRITRNVLKRFLGN